MPKFISKQLVLALHQQLIDSFGGSAGLRDAGLLDSALARPKITFDGELLHPTIYAQAAAYLYHLAKNHPFINGNKRIAVAVMETFLESNCYVLNLSDDEVFDLVLRVAQGNISKEELVVFLERCVQFDRLR